MSGKAVILIGEDDAGHFALIKKNLWRTCTTGEILHFQDGEEILNFLFHELRESEASAKGDYLLLLDIRLPKTDGIEVLRKVKEDRELRKMPVIMLTTSAEPRDVEACYQLGCSAYINKPCGYAEFMDAVKSLGHLLSMPEFCQPSIDPHRIGQQPPFID